MTEIIIHSFDEFVKWLEEEDENIEYWYRGQRNENWKLTPTLYRKSKWAPLGKSGTPGIKIANFDVPDMNLKYERFSKNYQKEFKVNIELSELQKLFFIQHEGTETFLLDWTTSPLVALFFSLHEFTESSERPCIYRLNPGLLNSQFNIEVSYSDGQSEHLQAPLNIDRLPPDDTIFKYSNVISPQGIFDILPFAIYTQSEYSHRITRQSGKFTIHGPFINSSLRGYQWHNYKTPDKKKEPLVTRALIDHGAIEELRRYLKIFNITFKGMYGEERD